MKFEFDGVVVEGCDDESEARAAVAAYVAHIGEILSYIRANLADAPNGDLAVLLGRPHLDRRAWTASYPENMIDREHIIVFDHDGSFGRLAGFRMDG